MQKTWIYNIGKTDIWRNDEEFETKEEAIEAGRIETVKTNRDNLNYGSNFQHKSFEVGRSELCSPNGVDVDDILENIIQNAYDEVGEVAQDYLDDVTDEHRAELEEKLNDVFFEWMKKYNYEPTFFKVEAIETIDI